MTAMAAVSTMTLKQLAHVAALVRDLPPKHLGLAYLRPADRGGNVGG